MAHVVVVGAGLGGLAAACHLVGAGHEVLVLEAGAVPGGRAGSLELGGYRFDTGPTVLTMPGLVQRCFDVLGVPMAEHLELLPVEPMYRACFADGSELRVRHGREAMAAEIAALCGPGEAAAFERFCTWLTDLYALEMPRFIDRNYDSPLDLAHPLGPALALVRSGAFRKLAPAVGRFFDDDRLRRLFSFQALYAGLAPYEALAVYAVITYMDTVGGVFVPRGGMHALPTAMAAALEQRGATVRLGARVERVELAGGSQGRVQGVRLEGGERIAADVVVCNPDLPVVYRTLLGGMAPPRVARRGNYSPSAAVWHVGVRGSLPEGVAHHNIHFGHAWDDAFHDLLDRGRRMADPSLLITVPTLDEPAMAPQGGGERHVLFVLEPVPNLDAGIDWRAERPRLRDDLARRVATLGYPPDVEVELLVDPTDWEAQGMERGTPFALSHRFFQTGPFRPANVEARAPGLVFVGSGTVPGVGVPMVLVSGGLAAERVEQQLARR